MSKTLWGKVYFKDTYAGRLEERPGGQVVFTYDPTYLADAQPAIAYTLPMRPEPYISERGLPPFFDNLLAEGWLQNAQARALNINPIDRFALLLGFGHDLAGAVSVVDPEPQVHHRLDHADEASLAALSGRASLSGVQRKLLVVKEGGHFRPVGPKELSTHIAKLASGNLNELLALEYLTTEATRILLAAEEVVEMELRHISAIQEDALVIPRFDRSPTGKRLHHFEEFNQLLGRFSGEDKYNGGYEEMARFILNTPACIPAEAARLFQRLLACFLVGNTDAHFKNFAMFHTRDGLRLTPAYDLVASAVYPPYQSIALHVCGIPNLALSKLQPKHLLTLGEAFCLRPDAVWNAVETLGKRLPDALTAIEKSAIGSSSLKKQLQEKMEKRWKGSFMSIGPYWLKKQNKDVKRKG
jgi:serine/threonine-protein kinase HipA